MGMVLRKSNSLNGAEEDLETIRRSGVCLLDELDEEEDLMFDLTDKNLWVNGFSNTWFMDKDRKGLYTMTLVRCGLASTHPLSLQVYFIYLFLKVFCVNFGFILDANSTLQSNWVSFLYPPPLIPHILIDL